MLPIVHAIIESAEASSNIPFFRTIKKDLIAYLIGSEHLKCILSISPQKHYSVPSENIYNSALFSNTETFAKAETLKRYFDAKEFFVDVTFNQNYYLVSHLNLTEKAIISYQYYFASKNSVEQIHTLNGISWRAEHRHIENTKKPLEKPWSIMRYKTAFVLYNFNNQTAYFITPNATRNGPYYSQHQRTILDLSQCHMQQQWLWDSYKKKKVTDERLPIIMRYNMNNPTDRTKYTLSNLKQLSEITTVIQHVSATSEDGSTCVSYFNKKDSLKAYAHSLVVWSGGNGQITKIIKLDPHHATPINCSLSADGQELTYETSSKHGTHICLLKVHSEPLQHKTYDLGSPLEWSIAKNKGVIIATCGKNQIHFINPHLDMHAIITTNYSWKSIPLLELDPTAESLMWSYQASPAQEKTATIKSVTLEHSCLHDYDLKHVAYAYDLLRAIRIAQKDQQALRIQNKTGRVLVDLKKKMPAHHDFIALPSKLGDFFLSTYGAPRGPLRIEGRSSYPTTTAWEQILY